MTTDPLADLIAERDELNERLAADPRERTDENYRARASLDRKIRRWTRSGPPGTKRYGYLKEVARASGNGSGSVTHSSDDTTLRLCEACGQPLPEYVGGRKLRADARYCPGGACKQRGYRERYGTEVSP